eukprot:TRINITY_DN16265_c0_g1_i3.p2 TRINITY_DN16265_c0_g1~~TRINITY_DN16265_c0_g1_i3.p2  ORF type:complete len:128 (+),score=2.64 TRINITY_DN16265_c0_g1_i3:124-507(+)
MAHIERCTAAAASACGRAAATAARALRVVNSRLRPMRTRVTAAVRSMRGKDSGHVRLPPANYAPTETDAADACNICMTHKRDTVVRPCGHYRFCWSCAQEFIPATGGTCPVCRQKVAQTEYVGTLYS